MLQGLLNVQAGVLVDVGIGRTMPAFLTHYKMPDTAQKQALDSASKMAAGDEVTKVITDFNASCTAFIHGTSDQVRRAITDLLHSFVSK